MRFGVAVFAITAAGGCGGDNDGGSTGPDAMGLACSLVPAPRPEETSVDVDVVFKVALPSRAIDDYGADQLYETDEGLLVLSSRSYHLVAPDGVLTSAAYSPDAPSSIRINQTAKGIDGYGALVEVLVDGATDSRFCLLGTNGSYDPARCVSLGYRGAALPRVAFDGTRYRVYTVTNGSVHRWVIDETPQLVDESDLWATSYGESGVLAVRTSGDSELLILNGQHREGTPCRALYEEWVVDGERNSRDVVHSDMALFDLARLGGSLMDGLSMVHVAACVDSIDCQPAPQQRAVFVLTTYKEGTPAEQVVPLFNGYGAVFRDAEGSVVVYVTDLYTIRLSRFRDGSATPEIHAMRLPLVTGASEAGSVFAGLTLQSGDYAVLFSLYGTSGTHLARISVP